MKRSVALLALVAVFVCWGAGCIAPGGDASGVRAAVARDPAALPFQRGMALADHVGRHDHEGGVESVRALRELGCDWIQISPFAFMPDVALPGIEYPDFTDSQTAYVDSLRALGFHVFLKPDIWSNQFWNGAKWRGDLRMTTEPDWRAWFDGYRDFLLHYAVFAEEHGIEMFCVGLEYVAATRERPEDWRALVADVRRVYSGAVTYAAHGIDEAAAIEWWDALDVVGVNLYPDLWEYPVTSAEELIPAWAPTVARLDSLAAAVAKPIVLTEIGFNSTPCAANDPWRWVRRGEPVSESEQAACYEATFRVLWGKPWLRGIYWWKWFIDPDAGGPADPSFTPQGKQASQVVARWYGAPLPSSPRAD